MKRLVSFFSMLALAAAALGLALACSDPLIESYCMGIPQGGCPSNQPSTCAHDAGPDGESGDPSCAALYTHSPSCVWTLVQTCPGYVPPKDATAASDAHDAADDVHLELRDAGFVLPDGAGGGDGCVDLESPDCPLELAVACGGTSCCGCETLYVCSGGGWNTWGQCVDGRIVPSSSP